MDNYTYGTTNLLENNQQSTSPNELASPNSVFFKNKTIIPKPQNASLPAMESFYDTITTEYSAPEDGAVYSVLNCDNMSTSVKKSYSSVSDETDPETNAIYHTLEVEECQM